jgi:hypothetical protein
LKPRQLGFDFHVLEGELLVLSVHCADEAGQLRSDRL